MLTLGLVVVVLIAVSFLCSILEAVILSISRPYIQGLLDGKKRAGHLLLQLKEKIEAPISAILTLNTISHTVGAAVSGAIALQVFGSKWMALFSAVLTLLILIFSEIIPKTVGALYWKKLGPVTAYILKGMIIVMKPLLIPIHYISRLFSRSEEVDRISKGELLNTVRLAYSQGMVQPQEFEIMENLFKLQSITVKEVMTPRPVVFFLPPDTPVSRALGGDIPLEFSRIPLYDQHKNVVEGIAMRRDIMNRYRDHQDVELRTLAREPLFVTENVSVYALLNRLIENKIHMAVVHDEFGDFTGIVTMEDAIETLLGREILDEYDKVADMRELARKRSQKIFNRK